ncbi:MAG: DNA polymerase III subunit delta' [Deltaproteobacteria bacterium]|nr:DNA polymerase III subunit delta' [Deltaproteobacteria bacterium]
MPEASDGRGEDTPCLTAVALTQAINCHESKNGDGCGRCRSCRQIMSGNFPDILFIKPDGQNIKIDQIRDLNRALGFKSVSGRYRVSIIHQAEMMTEEAANSFLKILEEPPMGNILILNVTEPLDLLPTIVSRCQKVPFLPISVRLMADWLMEQKNMDEEMALVLAKISEGSLGRVINMCESDFIEKRQDYLFKIIQLPMLSPEQAIEMVLEYTGRAKKRDPDASKKGDGSIFELLSIWKTWYRDLLITKVKGPEDLLINIDFLRKLKNISKNFKIDDLINNFLVLDQAQKDLMQARNLDLMMENTVLSLKGWRQHMSNE